MEALALLVRELSDQFPTVPMADLHRHCGRAVQDLEGTVQSAALPELLSRLVRLRLIAELLGDDLDVAALLCSATSLSALSRSVRAVTCCRLGCNSASLVLVDGDQCFHADENPIAPVWPGQRYPLTECLSGWAVLHDQSVLIDDVDSDKRVPASGMPDVRSMLAVPVAGRPDPVGAIGAYWPASHRADRTGLAWLQRLAEATGGVIAEIGLDDAPWAPTFRTRLPPRGR